MMDELDSSTIQDAFLQKANVIAIGSGLDSKDMPFAISELLKSNQKIILDAGGIDLVKNQLMNENVILTPHPGELNRLTGNKLSTPLEIINHLKEYCKTYHVNIIFKSHYNIFCDTKGICYLWNIPNSKLAVMGTGDLLVGILAFFLSRGYSILDSVQYALSILNLSQKMKKKISKHWRNWELFEFEIRLKM